MAQIFNSPDGVKVPELDFKNFAQYEKDCENYKKDLKAWLNKNGFNGKNVGEIIQFPVADGYAEYMVASMKPVKLVHMPLMDAWHFEYAHLMTAKEVQAKIDGQNALKKLFKK
jgi:glucan biosynthesis protein